MRIYKCERDVKTRAKEILVEYGAYFFMPAMNGFGRAGIPDIIVCHKGRFLALECKFGYNKPTPHQALELQAVINHGGEAMVLNEHNVEELRDVLARL